MIYCGGLTGPNLSTLVLAIPGYALTSQGLGETSDDGIILEHYAQAAGY